MRYISPPWILRGVSVSDTPFHIQGDGMGLLLNQYYNTTKKNSPQHIVI